MELWIRSQNKGALIRVEMLGNINGTIYSYLGVNQTILGKYKTTNRALEILDKIQNMIKPTLINTEYHSEIKEGVDKLSFDIVMTPNEDKITYIQPNVVVYEMPEK